MKNTKIYVEGTGEVDVNLRTLYANETCEHCGAKNVAYEFHFDVLDAVLLMTMAREVRERRRGGLDFTAANQVHVPSLSTTLAVRCRTTICSKLGLIAKCKTNGNQIPGVWVLTERGFAALRGESVPRMVKVRRGEIEERPSELTTLAEALQKHIESVQAAADRHRKPKTDYRALAMSYRPEEWYEIAGEPTSAVKEAQPALL